MREPCVNDRFLPCENCNQCGKFDIDKEEEFLENGCPAWMPECDAERDDNQ